MKKISQYEELNFERKMLWINGLYDGNYFPKRNTQDISLTIWFLSETTLLSCMIGKIIEESNDYELVFEVLHVSLMITASFIKLLYFRYKLSRFNALEESLKAPVFNRYSCEQEVFMSRVILDFRRLARIFWLLVFTTGTILAAFPLFNEKIWAIPIWTPLGDDRSARIGAQIFEIVCLGMMATTAPSVDMIPTILMNVMWAQLRILNDNLRNVTARDLSANSAVQEERIQERLRKCIEHHLAIISFVSHLEEIFSFGLFIQIFTSVTAICLTALQFLQSSPDTFVKTLFFLLILLMQIGMFCLIGQKIITESDLIGESCYMSEWYACTTSTKKMFFIIMERAKRPIVVRGGNFFEMSLLTFVMILRNAYSVFTLLMNFYS